VLSDDVELVLRGLELEAAVAEASAGAKFRRQVTAAALGLWSRSWLARLEALHTVEWGNYAAALPLVRSAADYAAAEIYVLRDAGAEWEQWLADGGIGLAADDHATEYRLHAFRAAEVLAANERLGRVYRVTLDLSMPHFGATLLLSGSASTPERVAITFGDRDFHLGLAEMCLGWLLSVSVAHVEAAADGEGVFGVVDQGEAERYATRVDESLARADRCRVDLVERDGMPRYLVENWRRLPGDAHKRILL
jgi:hypothetical protein